MQETERLQDAIRGCLIGGAAGDALGYAIEFVDENYIFSKYGSRGITEYQIDPNTGKALISDDTQMTLFTAAGLVNARDKGGSGDPGREVELAYADWLVTQQMGYAEAEKRIREGSLRPVTWLLAVPGLFARRAPGITCLSALQTLRPADDYIAQHRNNSKGCGGVMRVSPAAFCAPDAETAALLAAQIAAITHGHPLGYLSAAALAYVIRRVVYDGRALRQSVLDGCVALKKLFPGNEGTATICGLMELAVELSENGAEDLPNIHRLGEGWVGEEALAIALYCCLRHENDFSACLISAVNHKGDSDSTGAIAGNILGAMHGYNALADQWKLDLELADVILRSADSFCLLAK